MINLVFTKPHTQRAVVFPSDANAKLHEVYIVTVFYNVVYHKRWKEVSILHRCVCELHNHSDAAC
jgi:hypothetical protein